MFKNNRWYICFILLLLQMPVLHAQTAKPNVLFLVVDDLNDYLSFLQNFPGVKTPNLDRFTKSSLVFSKAYCAAPVCNPSRAAMLSGMAPYNTGVYDNVDKILDSKLIMSSEFLPEHFKANGYITLTRGKIFHSMPGKQRYEAMWDDDGGKGDYGPYPTERNIPVDIRAPKNFNYQPWTGAEDEHPDNVSAEYAIKHLQQSYDKPFFMAIGLYKPHNPWTAPKRFFDMFPINEVQLPIVPADDSLDIPAMARTWASYPVDFAGLEKSGKWRSIVQSYLACIAFMDWNLGRILDALEKSPYAKNTIICLMADNGFHMGEKFHFAKYALWEQTTHVLHIWKVPGVTPAGKTCERPVNLLDIYPTLDELCGLPAPAQKLDGHSIVPLLKNPSQVWEHPSITTYREGSQAVRTETHRYIHYADGTSELYDEVKDPREWKNIASQPNMQAIISNMKKFLQSTFVPTATPIAAGGKRND